MKPAVLLVRTAERIADDMAVCAETGWQGIPFAPMAVAADAAALARLPAQLTQAQAAFWVSPTAVETAARTWDFSGSLKNIAVGAATARALQLAGAANIIHAEHGNDSEAAAALPVWRRLPEHAKILIVRGHGGRGHLAQQLREYGLHTEFAEIYRRVPQNVDWNAFQAAAPHCAWVASSQAAEWLFAQASAAHARSLRTLPCFSQHPRIAATLAALGVTQTRLAADLRDALARQAA